MKKLFFSGWVAGVRENGRLLQKQVNYNSLATVASELY
jgi:hypothetical protein